MTIAELITRLQEMPQNAQVYISGDQSWCSGRYEDLSEDYIEYHDDSDPDYPSGVWLG